MTERAIVLAGHGSRASEANDALLALGARLGLALGVAVYVGFLELSEPSITSAIATAVADGHTRLTLVPYFLHPGMHVRRDLVDLCAHARDNHPGITIVQAEFLGAHPGMLDVLADLARSALAIGPSTQGED